MTVVRDDDDGENVHTARMWTSAECVVLSSSSLCCSRRQGEAEYSSSPSSGPDKQKTEPMILVYLLSTKKAFKRK